MKQEDKELLLKDLCARLPYGVRIAHRCNYIHELRAVLKIGMVLVANVITDECISTSIENVIPYLFPLSTMTEEQRKEMHNYSTVIWDNSIDSTSYEDRKIYCAALEIEWLDKNHFDYRGLIPMGLAIDATGLNIY